MKNDEVEAEFGKLVKINESQTLYLDTWNNWLFVKSFDDYKNGELNLLDINVSILDPIILAVAALTKDDLIIPKHTN